MKNKKHHVVDLKSGGQARGYLVEKSEEEVVLETDQGVLIIDSSNVHELRPVLSCHLLPVGSFVESEGLLYLKTEEYRFVQVTGQGSGLTILNVIDEGTPVEYEDLFPDMKSSDD